MIKASYEQLLERISRQSSLSREELEKRIEAKRAKLSGLISKEGAAQVVAAELGISFDSQKLKIAELLQGMRKVDVVAKILRIWPVRSFVRKGSESKVVNMLIADDTAAIRAVLWDTNHIALLENGTIKEGDVVEIKGAAVRGTSAKELHLTNTSSIALSTQQLNGVVEKEQLHELRLADLVPGMQAKIRAVITQIFEPRFFATCPECGVKVLQESDKNVCAKHGAVVPIEKVLLTMIIDDGSATMRALLFSETAKELLNMTESQIKEREHFIEKRTELLGKEVWLEGRARMNKLFNTNEFVVSSIQEVDIEQLLELLKSKKE